MSKALRKQGAEVLSEKKYPLSVNGLRSGLKLITGCFFFQHALALCFLKAFVSMGNPGS